MALRSGRVVIVLLGIGSLVATELACRRRPSTPPLATPALMLGRTRVTQGSPVDITYRFNVAPTARFDQDYRVFVHFLDAEGELMWTDDHDPPKPTSAWRPGETIEYTRTMFVPIYPYIGPATVAIGLYSPRTQARVTLAGEDVGQQAYKVATVDIAPHTENIFLVYKDGWHQRELAPDNPSVEWQWSKKEATLAFRNPKKDLILYLHFGGRPAEVESPQYVTVSVHDQLIERFEVPEAADAIRRITLPASAFGEAEMVEVRLHVEPTFVPALRRGGNPQDTRELGLRVFHAFVEPKTQG